MLEAAVLLIALAATSAPALAAKCTLARVAELPVLNRSGYPVVEGALNGQKVGVLLDSGAGQTMLVRPSAVRLGLVPRDMRNARVMGIGGETKAEMAAIDEFAVGPVVQKSLSLLVSGQHDLRDDVGVILGQDFLRRFEVEFDLPHNMVRLFQARDCDGVSLAYWAPGGAAEVDLVIDSSQSSRIETQVEINGRRFVAQLDTGSYRSTLTLPAAESIGVTSASPGVVSGGCWGGIGDKPIQVWIGQFDSFRIGAETIRDPKLYFADVFRHSTYTEVGSHVPRRSVQADMLLGADFLRSHRVLIAQSQGKMYFEYVSGTVFPTTPAPACDHATK